LSILISNSQTALSSSSTIVKSAQVRSSNSLLGSILLLALALLDRSVDKTIELHFFADRCLKHDYICWLYWFNHKTCAQPVESLGESNCQKYDNLSNINPIQASLRSVVTGRTSHRNQVEFYKTEKAILNSFFSVCEREIKRLACLDVSHFCALTHCVFVYCVFRVVC